MRNIFIVLMLLSLFTFPASYQGQPIVFAHPLIQSVSENDPSLDSFIYQGIELLEQKAYREFLVTVLPPELTRQIGEGELEYFAKNEADILLVMLKACRNTKSEIDETGTHVCFRFDPEKFKKRKMGFVQISGKWFIDRNATNPNYYQTLGLEEYSRKNYQTSAKYFLEAVQLGSKDPDLFYNLASSLALCKDQTAITYLDQAVDYGYVSIVHLSQDLDLESLHNHPRWQSIVEKCRKNWRQLLGPSNSELALMVEEDQFDRTEQRKANPEVEPRDAHRLRQAKKFVKDGKVKTALDYYHAALIFQHGKQAAEYKQAHELALKALELNPDLRDARWLAAASMDRWLWAKGKAQIYGTQMQKVDGKWTRAPFDEQAVSDSDRRKMNVPSLKVLKAQIQERNQTP